MVKARMTTEILAAKGMRKDGAGKHLFSIRFNKVTERSFIPYLEALSNMVVGEIRFSRGKELVELTLPNDLCKSLAMRFFPDPVPQK